MKKSIIAAAIVAAPAANAGVTIYGKVHVSVDYIDDGSDNVWSVTSRASRIGFKGTEDLGNGMSLIWKAETGYDFADGNAWSKDSGGTPNGRNAYIGLTGDWGTFLYGRHDTPYKMGYYATGIDMMGDTIMDMNSYAGFDEVRASNAIAYVSPHMNGLTFAGAVVPGENTPTQTGLADKWSVSAMYKNSGLKLAAGYEDLDSGNTKFLIGGSYTMSNLTVALAYEDDDGEDSKSLGAAVGATFGNNKVVLNYANYDQSSGETDAWGIGLSHSLSKRTSAYAAYADNETSDKSGLSFGMIHNF
ncbi:porin [Solemya elarraichensis gill symbiont]|uniref:Porin domain-containing protein n=1 Tax=Solemya elarraichensis gill symbiont TaxID=1918949 RepID=A0A1T2L205_9GAMM|nr:porin [Solemya elarraichensis gill symbiont]OOZ39101.1 hypothetical protein BOW52_07675 [Solemya elarraichensis gill symbiont]